MWGPATSEVKIAVLGADSKTAGMAWSSALWIPGGDSLSSRSLRISARFAVESTGDRSRKDETRERLDAIARRRKAAARDCSAIVRYAQLLSE
jgi:ATP-dependent DNA ligase